MNIRPPKFRELEIVVELGRKMHDESDEYKSVPYDENYAYAFARNALERFHDGENAFICVAVDNIGRIVGFTIGMGVPYIFSAIPYATDCAIYVLPENRGSSAGYRMIKGFEEWSKNKGIRKIRNGVSTGLNMEKTHAFYEKMGYNYVGGIFTKLLETEVR